jgi:hypothetical protein
MPDEARVGASRGGTNVPWVLLQRAEKRRGERVAKAIQGIGDAELAKERLEESQSRSLAVRSARGTLCHTPKRQPRCL